MAKFDIKTDLKSATKPLYAGVGVTDLAVEAIRDYVSGAQKRTQKRIADVQKIELEPKALRDQAVTRVNARVDALAKDAKARRSAIEKRVAELQGDAVSTVNSTYGDLVTRGEGLVTRIRRQESTKAATSSAKTATTKAKSTGTQATKAAKATKSTTASNAKKSASTAKKNAGTAKKTAAKKSAPAKSSAKATTTAAKKTASNATQAAGDAAAKVGN